jgi:hypothetical protein
MGLCTSKAQRAVRDTATQDAQTHDAKTHGAPPPVYEEDPPEPNMQDLISAEVDNQRRKMWASRVAFSDLYPQPPHVSLFFIRMEVAAWDVLRKLHPVEPPPAAVFAATVQQMALALSPAALVMSADV